jgi:hypothetical protein
VKQVLTWVVIVIIVLFVIKNPAGAAHFIQQITHALSTLAGAL